MNNKQAIEVLERMKVGKEYEMKKLDLIESSKTVYGQMIQALSHAINCVGAIEQIRAERDIAIQQLNELGYQFGEKIRSDEE